jgi:hypothetical protein
MSDADDQMGGHGGETGKDPKAQSNAPPDPVKGNMGDDGDEEKTDLPVNGKPQGQDQAKKNAENDPPA